MTHANTWVVHKIDKLQGMGVEDTTNYAKELLFIECQTKKTT
jgi:hypothetical protein